MGLSEKTRYVLANDLRPLIERGGELGCEQLRGLLLSLDRYRRELQVSIKRHASEERYLEDQVEQSERDVALWEQRLVLARDRAPAHAADAEARLGKARALLSDARERHQLVSRAIANLKVTFERVERALRLVRRKHLPVTGPSAGAPGGACADTDPQTADCVRAAALLAEELCPLGGVDGASSKERDPVEDVFETLELEAVADCYLPRKPRTT